MYIVFRSDKELLRICKMQERYVKIEIRIINM